MALEPRTLEEATVYFADAGNCREYLEERRWPDGVTCPRCGSKDVELLEKGRWCCRRTHDAPRFTVRTGTIMEDSPGDPPMGLDQWCIAMWKIVHGKNPLTPSVRHDTVGRKAPR
jgi:hypothetical protein